MPPLAAVPVFVAPSADPVKVKARSANYRVLKIKEPLQTCPAIIGIPDDDRFRGQINVGTNTGPGPGYIRQ